MFSLSICRCIYHCTRTYSSSVEKSLLSKLRKKTGFSLINCKKALEQFNNDIQQAEIWLREQAQKEGWTKATKLQGRPMSQGLVGLINKVNSATMVEVNCETDFVAKNEKFMELVSRIANVCESHFVSRQENKVHLSGTELTELKNEEGKSVFDLVALEIGNIGENMAARRAAYLKIANGKTLGSYVHSSGPRVTLNNCTMGKYGAFVEIGKTGSELNEGDSLDDFANDLSQHIVGMGTKSIGNPDDKPEKKKDDETKLLFQEYLMEPTLKVGKVLKQNNVEVKDFVRFECGEDLGDDS